MSTPVVLKRIDETAIETVDLVRTHGCTKDGVVWREIGASLFKGLDGAPE